MKVYFAADHAGFELKNELLNYVRDVLECEVEDCGATALDPVDDYPEIIARAGRALAADAESGVDSRAIVIGASGQGEVMAMNRFKDVRCALYYAEAGREQVDQGGKQLDMLSSTREHNNANALSLAARFLSEGEAKEAVKRWLETPFPGEPRHIRRTAQLDKLHN